MKKGLLSALLIVCLFAAGLIAQQGLVLIGQGGTGTATTFTSGSAVFAGSTGAYTNTPPTFTVTQFDTKVPDAVGEIFICSNCTVPFVICVATGTAKSQFVAMKTGSGCGTGN